MPEGRWGRGRRSPSLASALTPQCRLLLSSGRLRGAGPGRVTWSAPGWSPDSPRERCWPSGPSAGAGPACSGMLTGTQPWTWSVTASASSSSSRGGFCKESGFRQRPGASSEALGFSTNRWPLTPRKWPKPLPRLPSCTEVRRNLQQHEKVPPAVPPAPPGTRLPHGRTPPTLPASPWPPERLRKIMPLPALTPPPLCL